MNYLNVYNQWLADPNVDTATKAELTALAGNETEIQDRFFKDLEFGTGGMRGVLGAGTNRLNIYTIRKATQDFAKRRLQARNGGCNRARLPSHVAGIFYRGGVGFKCKRN
jgi:phosphoglucomutase